MFDYYIIDGNSSDRTVDLAKEISKEYPMNTLITSEPNRGIDNAMNKALDMVKGDWVIFMNAGDTFCNDYVLQKFSSCESSADFVYGDANHVNESRNLNVIAGEIDQISEKTEKYGKDKMFSGGLNEK